MEMLEQPVITETEKTGYTDTVQPVYRCFWCGCGIHEGDLFVDIGEKLCMDCVNNRTEVA